MKNTFGVRKRISNFREGNIFLTQTLKLFRASQKLMANIGYEKIEISKKLPLFLILKFENESICKDAVSH